MRKIAAILVLTLIPFCGQPIGGQPPTVGIKKTVIKPPDGRSGSDPNKRDDERGSKERPLVVDTEGHHQSDAERAQADAKEQRASEVERWTLYFAQLTAWATAALVIIGFGGVIAAVWTLRAIKRQTDLMAAQFYQCVYLMNWRVKKLKEHALQPDDFKVFVDLMNQSSFPITLVDGVVRVTEVGGSTRHSISHRTFLPPRIPVTIDIPIKATVEQNIHYDEWGTLDFPIDGFFSFVDRIDEKKTIIQRFSGRLYCGRKWGANFEWHMHMNPEPQQASGDQQPDQRERPN